jgi:hypothetical protein
MGLRSAVHQCHTAFPCPAANTSSCPRADDAALGGPLIPPAIGIVFMTLAPVFARKNALALTSSSRARDTNLFRRCYDLYIKPGTLDAAREPAPEPDLTITS